MRNHRGDGRAGGSMAFPTKLVPSSGNRKLVVHVPGRACRRLPLTGKSDRLPYDTNAMNTTPTTESLLDSPQPHWVSRAAFPILAAIFFLNQAALGTALYLGSIWFTMPLVVTTIHLMHGMLIGFHEASHGLLRKNRRLNEIDGIIIGVFSFMSLSLYRAAHQLHHAYLATKKDEELWPFDIPGTPRWLRVLCAVLALTVGMFYTPFLFIRTFFRSGSPIRNKKVRRRIWAEFILTPVVWAGILGLVTVTGTWKY